jgi:uncharacterized protein (TIGR03086 family)
MTPFPTAETTGGIALLERALSYTLGSLLLVTPDALRNPTPCSDWDLTDLLTHMNDSLAALQQAADVGHIDEPSPHADADVDLVLSLRNRGCALLGSWSDAARPESVSIASLQLSTSILTRTGAVEVAVHGWDVARACGVNRPIPPRLACELLEASTYLVTESDRPGRFAAPIDIPRDAPAGDRLLAYLGRDPA